jgi:predicted PurR-regulated permease PerM
MAAMPITRPTLFWIVLLALALILLWSLSAIMLPFVVGMAVAYFLDPAVDWLEARRFPRGVATAAVIVAFFALIVLVFFLFMPVLQQQVTNLVTDLPVLAESLRVKADAMITRLQLQAGVPPDEVRSLQQAASGQATKALDYAGQLLGELLHGGLALVNLLSLVFVTPVVAFYLLRDWDRMVARVNTWLPLHHAATIRAQAREIDRTLSGFARGQALLCLLLGVFYAVGLTLAGLEFGLIIGVVTGFLSFVPYVGTITGAVTSITLALVQFDDYRSVLVIGGVYLLGQALEGYVFQPLLVGDRIGLHPVWIIFALLAGGTLFGFVGVLIAVPVSAIIGVLCRFALGRYLASDFYDPAAAAPPLEPQPEHEHLPI